MKVKKFFGFDEKFGHYVAMAGLVIITLIFCGEHFGWLGDDRYEELKKSHREKVNLLTLQNQIQLRKIDELKEQLRVLESSAKKPEVEQSQAEEVQVEEETQAHKPLQVEELESMSDPEWQAWLLENADANDRKILESYFQQKNEFKASLNPAQRQEFDAEVEKAYEYLLANSGVEGELSDLQKQVTRQSAETVAMTLVKTKWQSREFLERWDAKMADLEEELEERDRLYQAEMEEEFLLAEEEIREFEEEFGLPPFDWGSLEEVELSPAQKEEMEEEFEAIVEEAERLAEEMTAAE